METIAVKAENAGTFRLLYERNALVVEGMPKSDLALFQNFVKSHLKRERLFLIDGISMNEYFHLNDSDAYPDTILLLCMLPEDLQAIAFLLELLNCIFHGHARRFRRIVDDRDFWKRDREKEDTGNHFPPVYYLE